MVSEGLVPNSDLLVKPDCDTVNRNRPSSNPNVGRSLKALAG